MRALKDKGIEDLQAIVARAKSLNAKDRWSDEDLRRLIDVAHEMEAVIVNGTEYDAEGNEIGGDA